MIDIDWGPVQEPIKTEHAATYWLDDGSPWHEYSAWHPVFTCDVGLVWAWPWRRVAMWRRFAPGFCHIYPFADAATYHEPIAVHSLGRPVDAD